MTHQISWITLISHKFTKKMNLTEFAQPAIFATSYLGFLSYKSQKKFEECKYIIRHSV